MKKKNKKFPTLVAKFGSTKPRFARNFNHVFIDMDYYNLYLDEFINMNVQFYALKTVTTSNGPLSFENQSYEIVAVTTVVWYKSLKNQTFFSISHKLSNA